ncbi:dihydroorotase [Marinirhabdus gelatinilytica]|uniref:Dihydroorotase n=1 Tax=Marinirhabdus gelatinilytica TaxID=1703343 RepID=A0A370QAM5_9FLAO|nr:dihydroorotase [Marinirhabdus gelatinilytica]RDK85402.1 dihydroorotase [Marinirhabdus gelatinilytica]
MSATLLKNATIVDPTSKHHLKKRDVLVEKGIIKKIAASISEPKAKEIVLKNLHISQGWFDSSVCFGEPGYEDRETIENGLKTAARSGFTAIALNGATQPVLDSKSGIQYVKGKTAGNVVEVYPVGTLTMQAKGEDLAELFDMKTEGAISFYDYQKPIENANLLKIALQYTQNFEGLVQSFPMDPSIARKGLVNEEINSTKLGLKGIPALSEELQITRDLYLLEYTGGKLHIPTISTKKSVQLIKEAKKKGLDVTCSVSINNLCLTDDELENFDTNFKVLPPLRTKKDIKSLLKGLKDGTIDGVTSNHDPHTIEDKKTEFDHAAYGSIGLESCFGALQAIVNTETSIKALTGLKERFGIHTTPVSEGSKANLTLFNPEGTFQFSEEHIVSTSKNAAMLGKTLKGTVYGIFHNKKIFLNE